MTWLLQLILCLTIASLAEGNNLTLCPDTLTFKKSPKFTNSSYITLKTLSKSSGKNSSLSKKNINLLVTSKKRNHEFANSPIHEFKVLQNVF